MKTKKKKTRWHYRIITEPPHRSLMGTEIPEHKFAIVADTPVDSNGGIRAGKNFLATRLNPQFAPLMAAAPELLNALKVMVLDKRIRSWLEKNDPMALRQAMRAIRKAKGKP